MAGCCGGPAPAIGVVLIILGVINLGLLPCSIPTIVLGSVLSGCCCVGCHVKSLATYVIVANTLLLVIQLGAGIGLLSSQDSICASILKIDSPIPGVSDAEYYVGYIKGTQALTDGCNFCRMIPAFCDSNAVLGCELCERGAKRDVGIDDLEEYVQAVLDLALRDGVRAQIDAFRKGFSEVLPAHHLRAFSPEELDVLFNGFAAEQVPTRRR